jgi:hypothetical protein
MNLLTTREITKKLEEWADQKIPELVPGPKLVVTVSLSRLVDDQLDELIKSLRLDGKTECAKIVKEDYEKLKDATKRATSDSLKRIIEFKKDRLDKQHNEISALDILEPNFKIPTDKPWKDNEILGTVYFDECAQCARQLAQTLRQVAKLLKEDQNPAEKKKGILRRLLKIIGAIVGFLAALFTCLGYLLGWLGPIKAFIGKILWPK